MAEKDCRKGINGTAESMAEKEDSTLVSIHRQMLYYDYSFGNDNSV